MRRPPLWIASTAAAAVLAAVPSLYAQATRLGTEFEVNAYTPGTQRGSAVAGDAGGGFVVAWQSYTQDGSGYGIFVRRFASTGAALATEFQANAYTIGGQNTPAVATESDGDFLVAWSSYYAQDGSGFGIFARRFTSTGAAIATEFQVNTYTPDQQSHPTAAFDADGDFVVTWQSYAQDRSGTGVFARRFASSGVALAVEFQVNAYTTNGQSYPSVAALTGGDFLIAWTSQAQDGASYGVFARRFASSGVALGAEFQVNAHTQLGQYLPRVAGNGNGDFLVAWESQGQDGSYLGVFARPFSSAGTALAVEFQVNRYTINGQAHATLSADADGDFVVAWDSANQDGSGYGVFARRVTTAGGFIGGEFQVNTYTPNYQAEPAIAAPPTGDFIVTWTSFSQDRSFGGVFAQRFATAPVPTPTSTSTPTSTPTPGPGAPAAVGVEFQLNTYTIGSQRFPSAASDDDGDFVVAWQSDVQDGSSDGVFGRRFSSAGAALAVEFQVNAHTFYGQSRPATAADADGDFVIVWQSLGQDGSSYGIFARRFSSSGAPQGFEFQVNHYSFGSQFGPSVAMEGDGDFVVVWGSYVQDGSNAGVFGRRFASSGAALAAEFQVNAYTTSSQAYPSVAVADDGEFVIVWQSQSQDGSYSGVFGRRFSSTGAALAAEFQINAYTVNYQFAPSVANDADGDFVVAWASYLQDGSGYGVFGRRFSSAGVPLAVEFRVNEHTPSSQLAPSVTADDDGDFVIAWQDLFHDGSVYGVFARRFTSAGVAFATEFQVNSYTTGYQIDPSAAAQANGDFVIAWSSVVQDGSNGGVFARRFTVGSESTPTPTPTATATPTATSTPPPATATDTPTATPSVTASATPTSTPTSTPTPSATASPTPTATASPTPTATASATPPPDPDHFACYQSNTTNKVCFDASGQPCNNDADCGGVKHACSNAFTSFAPIPGVRLSDQFADEATFVIGSPDRLCAPASKTWLDGTILHVDQADDLDGTHLVRYPVTATLPPVSTLFPPPGCATCAGGATYLNFRYTGATAASVRVLDSTNAVLFDQVVNPGGAFAVSGTAVNGTFLGPLRIFVGTLLHATLVTDCSRPLGPGLGVGAAFVVVDALSAATGAQPLCPVIRLTNQFETLYLERGAPREVLVPSAKALPSAGFPPGAPPDDVDHFECYDVKATAGRTGIVVHVADQFWNDEAADPSKFGPARDLRVLVPARLCNPVTKEGPVPGAQQRVPPAAQAHLLCYNVQPVSPDNSALKGLFSSNQLGQLRLDLGRVKELCVPSLKLAPAPLP